MIIAAMIPAIGVGLILVPTIFYMLFTSQILLAIILIIGLLFISTIDTVIRPHLIGKETEMPDMLITISILGGLSLLGTTGLVIGPVIAGFFLTM
jgi:predicted PurR-regulated permease PerM